jgi:hypothetical protein
MSKKKSTTSGHTSSKTDARQVAKVPKGAMPRSRVKIQRGAKCPSDLVGQQH